MNWKRLMIVLAVLVAGGLMLRGKPLEPPTTRLDEADLESVISQGESVDLADHVAKRGWTVVEFAADW